MECPHPNGKEDPPRQGACAGMSIRHAGSARLILGSETGDVVSDSWSSTVVQDARDVSGSHVDK